MFKYGGGFAGLRYQLNGDSNDLEEQYKKSLEALPGFDVHTLRSTNPQARDMLRYTLTVDDAGKQTSLAFSDDNIPAEIEPLVAYLRDKADPA